MFKELLPMLQSQSLLTITLSAEGENMIRANIIPHQKQGEEAAMAQPLSILATAEELDAELPNVLTGFVEERSNLSSALADYKAQAEAAKKKRGGRSSQEQDQDSRQSLSCRYSGSNCGGSSQYQPDP